MDVLRFRSSYPTLLHPFDYFRFKKNFQPKLAPPRKKPAYSSIYGQASSKGSEDFGLNINPPTLCLSSGCCFTFLDGAWVRSTKRGASKTRKRKSHAGDKSGPPKRFTSAEELKRSPRRPTAERDRDLERCRTTLTEQFEKEKQELEEYYKQKLIIQKAEHCALEERLQKEHENQVNSLLIRYNELKGENNLLLIKLSKLMDMLAECTAEVCLQEAQMVQVNNSLQQGQANRLGTLSVDNLDSDDVDEEECEDADDCCDYN